MLTYSNIAEADYAEWNIGTSYSEGGRCIVSAQHKVYEALTSVTGGSSPEVDVLATPPKWVLVGSTNKYKMFDNRLSEQTSQPGFIRVTIKPGTVVNAIYLGNISGTEVTVVSTVPLADSGSPTTYTKTINLLAEASEYSPFVADAYDYAFEEIATRSDIVEFDIPPYMQQSITITIKYQGGTAKCGVFMCGLSLDVGTMLYGGQLTLVDYSVGKEADEYGDNDVIERGWAKEARVRVLLKNTRLDIFYRFLSTYRATPVIWVMSQNFSCMIVYGLWSGPSFSLNYPEHTFVELELKGLTANN
jgi:hypothetical protein